MIELMRVMGLGDGHEVAVFVEMSDMRAAPDTAWFPLVSQDGENHLMTFADHRFAWGAFEPDDWRTGRYRLVPLRIAEMISGFCRWACRT